MRKEQLFKEISKSTGVEKVDVLVVLEAYFKKVEHTLSTGESIYIRGYATIAPTLRKAKKARNIKTGETIDVDAYYKPTLKFCKAVIKTVRDNLVIGEDMKPVQKGKRKTKD